MKDNLAPSVLISDRNNHVRELILRELQSEDLCVQATTSGAEFYSLLITMHPSVAVCDPELFVESEASLLTELIHTNTRTYFIIHTFKEYFQDLPDGNNILQVAKTGTSVEEIRNIVLRLTGRRH